jgi:hypothetical protein
MALIQFTDIMPRIRYWNCFRKIAQSNTSHKIFTEFLFVLRTSYFVLPVASHYTHKILSLRTSNLVLRTLKAVPKSLIPHAWTRP